MLECDKYFLLSVMQWSQSITNDVILNFDKTPLFVSALHYQFYWHYNFNLLGLVTHHLDLRQALLIPAALVVVVVVLIIPEIDHYLSQVRLQIEHITIISNPQLHSSSDYYSKKHCFFKHYLAIS